MTVDENSSRVRTAKLSPPAPPARGTVPNVTSRSSAVSAIEYDAGISFGESASKEARSANDIEPSGRRGCSSRSLLDCEERRDPAREDTEDRSVSSDERSEDKSKPAPWVGNSSAPSPERRCPTP